MAKLAGRRERHEAKRAKARDDVSDDGPGEMPAEGDGPDRDVERAVFASVGDTFGRLDAELSLGALIVSKLALDETSVARGVLTTISCALACFEAASLSEASKMGERDLSRFLWSLQALAELGLEIDSRVAAALVRRVAVAAT